MNIQLKIAQEMEKARIEIEEIIENMLARDLEYIKERRSKDDSDGVEMGIATLLMRLFCEMRIDINEEEKEIYDRESAHFIKALYAIICYNNWDYIDDYTTNFFKYWYFLKRSIFSCINIGYPGGISYLHFVENILQEQQISSSKEQRKKLADGFKMYLSKNSNLRGDFIKAILAERMTHESISDKNKSIDNDTLEYGPILLYEKVGYEFEFFMRNKNRTKGMEKIMEQLDEIAQKRIQVFSTPLLPADFKEKQSEYAKLVKKAIPQMTDIEIKKYREYMQLKRNYIRKYSRMKCESQKLAYLEELKFDYDLLLIECEDEIYGSETINVEYYDPIGRALWKVIQLCGNNKQERQVLWDALINFLNIMENFSDLYEMTEEYRPMIDLLVYSEFLEIYKKLWSEKPTFSVHASEQKIQELYVKDLQEKDCGLRDYIELCMLTCNILPRKEELDQLENAFKEIFIFLRECQNQIRERKDVIVDFTILNEKVGYDGEREDRYDYEIYRIYFQECIRTRYIRLYKIIHNEIKNNKEVNPDSIVKKYLDSIFPKYTDIKGEQRVSQKYRGELHQFLLSELIKCLYPNKMSDPTQDDIYEKRDRILLIASQYGFAEALGFQEISI